MRPVRGTNGVPLLCCWDDCERNGYEEYKLVRTENKKQLHYVFCSPGHRQLYANSHLSHGNLSPAGPRTTPLGLILP